MANTVSVTCPCGSKFEREVKRGRPAQWCVECRKLPMAQRVAKPVEMNEDGEVVVERKVSRLGSHDKFTFEQREQITANVADVTDEHFARVERFKAEDFRDYPEATSVKTAREFHSAWYSEALKDAYRKVDPTHC
jgi:hypothetical protein